MRAYRAVGSMALLVAAAVMLMAPVTLHARPVTETARLMAKSEQLHNRLDVMRAGAYADLIAREDGPQARLNRDRGIELMYVDERGVPRFYSIDNYTAAQTVGTYDVWPAGGSGLNLTGSGTLTNDLAVWDGGGVRLTHLEFGGRVTQQDSPSATHYHATHVAGTMVAAGVSPGAQGMSYEAQLSAYDWNDDNSEMAAAAAAGLNVSNHSYAFVTGWYYSSTAGDWYWYGDTSVSATEDYGFGFYCDEAQAWDDIAYDAPYYTIVKSAGNDRNDAGPGAGGGHYVWDGDWVWSTDTRDADGGATGYDTISWNTTAKNIVTVGAVGDIAGGYSQPSDVVMSSFSGWGPTDDGRIKPDLVANGVGLYSTIDSNDSAYASYSGTSMSAPNLAGSLNLLVRFYESTHGSATPLSATTKALMIQTADEAGSADGPDYEFGWGLLNTESAALVIEADGSGTELIREESLGNGESDVYYVSRDADEPIRVTVAWTDLPGTPVAPALDPPNIMLVNDLDVRIQNQFTGHTYEPYVLDPANPSNAATTGDNFRDNVEQIYIASPAVPDTALNFVITVSHKGALSSAQDYSIVSSHELLDSPTGFGENGTMNGRAMLHPNSPNPFNPTTTISYELSVVSEVSLSIYDIAGRVVRTLRSGSVEEPGMHRIVWDGRDAAGRTMASGVYLYRLQAGEETHTRRAVMLK